MNIVLGDTVEEVAGAAGNNIGMVVRAGKIIKDDQNTITIVDIADNPLGISFNFDRSHSARRLLNPIVHRLFEETVSSNSSF